MGCGKSTVGRLVAKGSGARFCDLDDRIEQAAGVPLATLFADRGEPAFRRLEQQQVAILLDEARPANQCLVVALGGGTLLDPRLKARALSEAFVVTLSARIDTIAARAAPAASPSSSQPPPGRRPLLDGADPRAKIEHLLKQRGAAYDQTHATISTDDRTPELVADELLSRWQGWRPTGDST